MQIAETTLLKKNQIQRITFNNFQKFLRKSTNIQTTYS